VSVHVHVDSGATRGRIAAAMAALPAVTRTAVAATGGFAQTLIRANASTGTHRPGAPHLPGTGPGPNVGTGDLRRGVTLDVEVGPGEAAAEVGPTAVQAARLEYGFIGRDSLGRFYRQHPYPFVAPAEADAIAFLGVQAEAAAAAISALLGGDGA
jgi:hypothetical protein